METDSLLFSLTYTQYGERKQITYGNGTVTNYDYDVRRRMENVNHQFPAFNIDKQYVYDPLSNIINIVTDPNSITSPSTGVLGGPVNHTYIYDNYNRLVEAYGHYVGPDDEPSGMLKQDYHLEMAYDLSHNIVSKNQIHQFGSVSTLGQSLPTNAPHAPTSYSLEYGDYAKGVYIADNQGYAQPHAPRVITEYPPDYSQNPDEMRVKKKMIDYDANGNQTEIREQVSDPEEPLGYREVAVRKNLWDEDDRLMGVDLAPENPRDKPLIAAYTYSADGERAVRYLPGRLDAYYSAKDAGSTDRLESILYPNPLITVKTLPLPEGLGMDEIERLTITKYTKHYYIGSERVASALGHTKHVGMLCEQSGFPEPDIITRMNEKVNFASEILETTYASFDKGITLPQPFYYETTMQLICDVSPIPGAYAPFWYHPDHLGSSSYITNLSGEINQHMEYLPFGELLVEEHLNSYNSPFKFNAKELDAETGNYYYGARYYDPKWSIWLSVDPLTEFYPNWSPYNYTYHNPMNWTDSTGMCPDGDCPEETYNGGQLEEVVITAPTKDRTWTSEVQVYNRTPEQYQKDYPEFAGMSDGEMVDYHEKNYGQEYRDWDRKVQGNIG